MKSLYIVAILVTLSVFGVIRAAPSPDATADQVAVDENADGAVDLDSRFSLDDAKTAITTGAKKVQAGAVKVAHAVRDGVNTGYEYIKGKFTSTPKGKYGGLDYDIDVRIDNENTTKAAVTKREAGKGYLNEFSSASDASHQIVRKGSRSPSDNDLYGRNILSVPLKSHKCSSNGKCHLNI